MTFIRRLDDVEGETLMPALTALVQRYPQRLYFPLRLSALHRGPAGKQRIAELQAALGPQPQLAGFAQVRIMLSLPRFSVFFCVIYSPCLG